MIYVGLALVAFWTIQLFYARRPLPSELDNEKSAVDRWVTRHAERLRLTISITIMLLWIYGVHVYPDAPITRCGDGFCGKQGHARTLAEFRSFEKWQSLLFFSFFLGCLSIIYLSTKIRRERRD